MLPFQDNGQNIGYLVGVGIKELSSRTRNYPNQTTGAQAGVGLSWLAIQRLMVLWSD